MNVCMVWTCVCVSVYVCWKDSPGPFGPSLELFPWPWPLTFYRLTPIAMATVSLLNMKGPHRDKFLPFPFFSLSFSLFIPLLLPLSFRKPYSCLNLFFLMVLRPWETHWHKFTHPCFVYIFVVTTALQNAEKIPFNVIRNCSAQFHQCHIISLLMCVKCNTVGTDQT